jgi:H+/gluconate symporter-like permease
MSKLTDFAKGIIVGVVGTVIIFGIIFAFYFLKKRDKELLEYAEKQIEIEAVREDYRNRDPDEFFEIPDVRRAADGAAAEFERKRDEALQRFRSRVVD